MTERATYSYDEVLYPSRAYKSTRPDNLAAVARLFGMTAPDFRKSDVLEIGCASGGNLIPMAAAYPDSRFVGIDMSGNRTADSSVSTCPGNRSRKPGKAFRNSA